ncbi:UNVERIFIED_CONTAM: hypothetical protein O8I53_05420 [Campylobacter lari]
MPDQNGLIKMLLEKGPMYVTSANISGKKPIDIKDANLVFPQVKNIYNFGECSNKASQIYNADTNE